MENTVYILNDSKGDTLGVFTSKEKLNDAREMFHSHPINEDKETFTIIINTDVFYDSISNTESEV